MITAAQLRAARALLRIDQQTLADLAGVSLPTIQRMEASQGNVRGVVDTLTKVVEALNRAGLELVADYARSDGRGRGVRMREPEQDRSIKTKVPTKKTGRVGSGREKMPDSAMNNAGGTQRRK
jgi:transcriptional regulator with XRE-family HTH domain